MKTIFTALVLLSFLSVSKIDAQPLNNSFENWASGMPVDWFASGPQAVSQVSVAYQGASSAKLEVVDLGGFAFIPVMQSLTSTFSGHPVSEKHGSLQGWYQLMPLGGDVLVISVSMLEGSSTAVGAGGAAFSATTSGWTQFNIPIFYIPGSPNPDNTIITVIIADTSLSGETGTIGSMGYVDYLTFTGPSSVEQLNRLPADFSLSQNYPNPFNPTTNIEYSIPQESFVELKVYDILGNKVAELVNEVQSAGTYRADFSGENLASGLYIARIKAGNFTQSIKMSLMK